MSEYTQILQQAVDNGIIIYTVGLGSANALKLQYIADFASGKYYHASAAEELESIYDDIYSETADLVTDSNNDGICDYYTELLCQGKLVAGNGIDYFNGISYEDIQADIDGDYDNDGLLNGEEVIISLRGDGKVYVKVISDPRTAYSDNDIYGDFEEIITTGSDPLRNNIVFESSDINTMADGNNFYAFSYKNECEESWLKKSAIWIGNNIFGSNYDKIALYEDALISMFEHNSEANWEAKINMEAFSTGMEYAGLVNDTVFEVLETIENKQQKELLKNLLQSSEHTKQTLAEMAAIDIMEVGFTPEQYYAQIDSLNAVLRKDMDQIDELNLMIKGKKTTPIGKGGKIMESIFNVYEFAVKPIYDTYVQYNRLCAQEEEIKNNIYILELVKQYSDDDLLKIAAENIHTAAKSKADALITSIESNLRSTSVNLIGTVIKDAVYKLIPYGFWIDLTISILDIIIPVSTCASYAVKICGIAYVADYLSADIKQYFMPYGASSKQYTVYDYKAVTACKKYQNLCNVRAFGEILMAEMEETGADWLNDVMCFLTGFDSQQLAKECRSIAEWAYFYKSLYYTTF